MSIESFRGPGGADLFYQYDDFTDPWEDAPTAILAHGFPRNSNLWYGWVPLLSRQLRVVRTDLRGLGLSKVPIDTFQNSLDSLVLDAIALMDHLKLSKAVWIGEATGAIVGLSLAIRVPDRLHALTVMNFPLRPGEAQLDESELAPGESVMGQASLDLMLAKGMRHWAGVSVRTRPGMKEAPLGYVEWYMDQISRNDPLLTAQFYRAMPEVDLVPVIKDVGVPTLYLGRGPGLNAQTRAQGDCEAGPQYTHRDDERPWDRHRLLAT